MDVIIPLLHHYLTKHPSQFAIPIQVSTYCSHSAMNILTLIRQETYRISQRSFINKVNASCNSHFEMSLRLLGGKGEIPEICFPKFKS